MKKQVALLLTVVMTLSSMTFASNSTENRLKEKILDYMIQSNQQLGMLTSGEERQLFEDSINASIYRLTTQGISKEKAYA